MDRQFIRNNHKILTAVAPALRQLEEGKTPPSVITVSGGGVGVLHPPTLQMVMNRLWSSFCERHGHNRPAVTVIGQRVYLSSDEITATLQVEA